MMGESTIQTPEIKTKLSKVSSDQFQNRTIVRLKNVGLRHELGHWLLQNINMEIRAGQMVGLAGVAGSGQASLAEVLVGLRNLDTGEYQFAGEVQRGLRFQNSFIKVLAISQRTVNDMGLLPILK